jgi:3'-phosphoadenosine 5'-phosphosulfate (PAPS) 3'-phosphatase
VVGTFSCFSLKYHQQEAQFLMREIIISLLKELKGYLLMHFDAEKKATEEDCLFDISIPQDFYSEAFLIERLLDHFPRNEYQYIAESLDKIRFNLKTESNILEPLEKSFPRYVELANTKSHHEKIVAIDGIDGTLNYYHRLNEALVVLPYYFSEGSKDFRSELLSEIASSTRDIRTYCVSNYELAYVAKGSFDACIMPFGKGSKWWDFVMILTIQEAGGKVTDLYGEKWSMKSAQIIATNKHLHDSFLEIVQPIWKKYFE